MSFRYIREDLCKLVFIGVFFFAAQPMAWGATYYVRADGIAPDMAAATSCSSGATAMNVSTLSWQSLSAGDRIVLCDEGGVFRAPLGVSSSGLPGSPITYDGRGSAVFLASDLVGGWALNGGNVYVANLSVQPQQVFIDGNFGDRKASRWELTGNLDWYWEANQLYLFSSTGDPDGVYNNPGVEAGVRQTCVDLRGHHVVVTGITVRHANRNGFGAWNSGSHVTIKNNLAEWNWVKGIGLEGDTLCEDITIENNVARFNGNGGLGIAGPARNSIVRRNTCYGNGKYQGDFDYFFQWTFGIAFWERNGLQEGIEIYDNVVYDNGRGHPGDQPGRGVGIWLDTIQADSANPTIIRHNLLYDNKGHGIFMELSSNTVVHGNVLFNNATVTGGTVQFGAASIAIDARSDNISNSDNNRIFNNTVYGGRYGIKVVTYGQAAGTSVSNNIVKNNIVVGTSEHSLYCLYGGDNDGIWGSGNVYEYNSFGAEFNDFISWGGTDYDTYAAWESAYGDPSHSIEGDPQLAGNSANSLYLTAGSPCRDAGANLGPVHDDALLETAGWVDSVETSDQDWYGGGWDAGAYLYSGFNPILFADGFESGDTAEWTAAIF